MIRNQSVGIIVLRKYYSLYIYIYIYKGMLTLVIYFMQLSVYWRAYSVVKITSLTVSIQTKSYLFVSGSYYYRSCSSIAAAIELNDRRWYLSILVRLSTVSRYTYSQDVYTSNLSIFTCVYNLCLLLFFVLTRSQKWTSYRYYNY